MYTGNGYYFNLALARSGESPESSVKGLLNPQLEATPKKPGAPQPSRSLKERP